MTQKLLLASCIDQVIGKLGFLFKKPLNQVKVVCITTAANVYAPSDRDWLDRELHALKGLGMHLTMLDIVGKRESEIAKTIENADVVHVTGGNTYYLMEHMHKCGFKSAIVPYLAAGGVYMGSSAGSVVACPTVDFIRDMDDAGKANLTDNRGLGLVNFNLMPHIDHPQYGPMAQEIIVAQKDCKASFLGLKDCQAVFVADHYMEIF